jgi:hypothetical protein
MKDKVKEALRVIREKNGFNLLRNCATIWEGYIKLTQILPEILLWDLVSARQLVFSLQRKHKINFGVCSFYEINDDGRQYCTINGKIECLCRIPELFCILRDTKRKNKNRKIKAF